MKCNATTYTILSYKHHTIHFRLKQNNFGPKKGHFGQSGPKNGPLSSQTGIYRKTKGAQSYFRIWGSYDPID